MPFPSSFLSLSISVSLALFTLVAHVIMVPAVWNEISETWRELDKEMDEIKELRAMASAILAEIPVRVHRKTREQTRATLVEQLIPMSKPKLRRVVIRRKIVHRSPKRTRARAHAAPIFSVDVGEEDEIDVPPATCTCTLHNSCPSGPRGPKGIRGPAGYKGRKGKDGLHGEDAFNVSVYGIPSSCAKCLPGPPGLVGKSGTEGPEGIAGSYGSAGQPGRHGTHGAPGKYGIAGKEGEPGPPGVAGVAGAAGIKGRGERGQKGSTGSQGPMGKPGDRGKNNRETGSTGPAGSPGDRGHPGRRGRRGQMGEKGKKGEDGEKQCECFLYRNADSQNEEEHEEIESARIIAEHPESVSEKKTIDNEKKAATPLEKDDEERSDELVAMSKSPEKEEKIGFSAKTVTPIVEDKTNGTEITESIDVPISTTNSEDDYEDVSDSDGLEELTTTTKTEASTLKPDAQVQNKTTNTSNSREHRPNIENIKTTATTEPSLSELELDYAYDYSEDVPNKGTEKEDDVTQRQINNSTKIERDDDVEQSNKNKKTVRDDDMENKKSDVTEKKSDVIVKKSDVIEKKGDVTAAKTKKSDVIHSRSFVIPKKSDVRAKVYGVITMKNDVIPVKIGVTRRKYDIIEVSSETNSKQKQHIDGETDKRQASMNRATESVVNTVAPMSSQISLMEVGHEVMPMEVKKLGSFNQSGNVDITVVMEEREKEQMVKHKENRRKTVETHYDVTKKPFTSKTTGGVYEFQYGIRETEETTTKKSLVDVKISKADGSNETTKESTIHRKPLPRQPIPYPLPPKLADVKNTKSYPNDQELSEVKEISSKGKLNSNKKVRKIYRRKTAKQHPFARSRHQTELKDSAADIERRKFAVENELIDAKRQAAAGNPDNTNASATSSDKQQIINDRKKKQFALLKEKANKIIRSSTSVSRDVDSVKLVSSQQNEWKPPSIVQHLEYRPLVQSSNVGSPFSRAGPASVFSTAPMRVPMWNSKSSAHKKTFGARARASKTFTHGSRRRRLPPMRPQRLLNVDGGSSQNEKTSEGFRRRQMKN